MDKQVKIPESWKVSQEIIDTIWNEKSAQYENFKKIFEEKFSKK